MDRYDWADQERLVQQDVEELDRLDRMQKRRKRLAEEYREKLSPEAYNVLVDIYNESALSLKQIASILIVESAKRVVYDKES